MEEKFETTVGDRINWQWLDEFFFSFFLFSLPSNRRLPIERVEGPSLGGSRAYGNRFQYQLKWRLRCALAFGYTRRVYSRVVQTLCRTSHLKAKGTNSTDWNCPVLFSLFFFSSYLFLSFSRGWRSLWFVCHSVSRCIGSMQPTIWGTKRHRNEGYECPSEKSVSTYRWEL